MSYTCVKCKGKIDKIEESVICVHCGYRILMKDRKPGARRVIAR